MAQNQTEKINKIVEEQNNKEKNKIWHDRFLYDLPDGKQTYLTKKEKAVANRLLKEVKEKKLIVLIPNKKVPDKDNGGFFNKFFMNPYVQSLDGDLKFFAKQFYKSYIMDFKSYRESVKKSKQNKGSRR